MGVHSTHVPNTSHALWANYSSLLLVQPQWKSSRMFILIRNLPNWTSRRSTPCLGTLLSLARTRMTWPNNKQRWDSRQESHNRMWNGLGWRSMPRSGTTYTELPIWSYLLVIRQCYACSNQPQCTCTNQLSNCVTYMCTYTHLKKAGHGKPIGASKKGCWQVIHPRSAQALGKFTFDLLLVGCMRAGSVVVRGYLYF
jgi:hypothetical protein